MNIKFLHPMNSLIPFTNRGVNSLLYPYDFDFSPTIFPTKTDPKRDRQDQLVTDSAAKSVLKSKNKATKALKPKS